ncbi:hypothetical protein HY346_02860 [Candidatus Microgenomates bacterium]|nr:hypothetical protein [Candidatus Microgenomates bacterium]
MVDRHDRMSDVQRRQKSPEQKVSEAVSNIERCLTGNTDLRVTQSPSGHPRVRAFIMDEDAHSGWIEDESYAGAVKIDGGAAVRYLAEWHFPRHQGSPTYFWELDPETGELLVTVQRHEGEAAQTGMAIPADETHQGYFLRMTGELVAPLWPEDYEKHAAFRRDPYVFQLEELR